MFTYSKYSSYLILVIVFAMAGCSDNSTTGADQPEPPAIPAATPAEINGSIFDNNNPSGAEFALFNEAATFAETASAQISGGTALGQTYLEFTQSNDPVYQDGIWSWTFTSNENNIDVSVRTTAEQLQGGYQWNVYISGSYNGEAVSEFQFLSGFMSENGDTGNWEYFAPGGSDQPILEYQWEKIDETQSSFSSIFSGINGNELQRINFIRDGSDNTLEYNGFTNLFDVEIYWNSENGSGYIDREGSDRRCWDESFIESACS
jgi:hypothetical protein